MFFSCGLENLLSKVNNKMRLRPVILVLLIFASVVDSRFSLKEVLKRRRRQLFAHASNSLSIQHTSQNLIETEVNRTVTINVGDRLSSVGGIKVRIRCPFFGQPHPRATWYFKGHVIDHVKYPNVDITEPNGVSVLTILQLDPYHAGDYKCSIYNKYGTRSSTAQVRQIVAGQPTIFSHRGSRMFGVDEKTANVSIGTDMIVFQGAQIIFWCDVRTKGGTYDIRWVTPPTSNRNKQVIRHKSVLEINGASQTDNGFYYCSVSNANGPADRQRSLVTVKRQVKPKIQSRNDFIRYIRDSGEAFMQIGDTGIIKAGFTVKISCPYSAVPSGKITWMRNGMALAIPSGNLDLQKDRNTLIIKNIETRHSDIYSCAVENVLGKVMESSNITVIPKDSSEPKLVEGNHRNVINIDSVNEIKTVIVGETVRIIEGAALKLKCESTGVPEPEIIWSLNRRPIKNDQIIQTTNELLILNFKKEFAGDYKCVAKNIIGQSRAWSDVRIVEPTAPSIRASGSSYKIGDQSSLVRLTIGDSLKTSGGRSIEIKCPITGYPKPPPLWKHGDVMLRQNEKIVVDAKRQTLTLKDVDQWHSGIYSCFATNFAGVAMSSSNLDILPRGSPIITSKKRVTKILDPTKKFVDIKIGTNITTTTGRNLRIVCPSVGFEDTRVEWTIDGKNLHYDTRIVLSNGNELIINDLQLFDEGVYQCRVYSQYGFDVMSSNIKLLGHFKEEPKISSDNSVDSNDPKFAGEKGIIKITSGKDIIVISGQSVHIRCPATGSTRPTLQWFKDNIPIIPNNRLLPRGDTLMLRDILVDDAGLYTCRMTNEIGSKTTESNVKILEYKRVHINSISGHIKIIDYKKSVLVNIGKTIFSVPGVNIKITCPYTALPKPKITWYHNSNKVIDGDRFSQDKLTDALIISKVSKLDVGTYTCRAVQGENIAEESSKINVLSMKSSKITRSKRQYFTNPLHNDIKYLRIGDSIVVNLGKRIQIDCQASGLPIPKFIWKFNGKSIADQKYLVDMNNGSILVQRVTWDHDGEFECFAINTLGVDSVISKVKVVGPYTPTNYKQIIQHIQVVKKSTRTTSVNIGTTVSLRAGNKLIMKCPVNLYGNLNIFWEKEKEMFKGDRVHADGSVLIKKVKLAHSGDYECYSGDEARLNFGTVTLKVIAPIDDLVDNTKAEEVAFYFPQQTPLDVGLGSKVNILRGNMIRFACPVVKKANVKIFWYKDNQQIMNNQKDFLIEGTTMVVKNTQKVGKYKITCKLSGTIGSKSVSSELNIVAPTKINLLDVSQDIVSTKSHTKVDVGGRVHVLDGSSIEMTCPVSAIPPPTIRWQRDKAKVEDEKGAYMKKMGYTLSIPFLRKPSAGTYTCVASNQFGGEVEASIEVVVYVPKRPRFRSAFDTPLGGPNTISFGNEEDGWQTNSFIATEKTTIADKIGRDYKILTGPKFNLTCDAEGEPIPTIKWRLNGNEIPNSDYTVIEIDTSDLNQSGYYTCIASNAFGSVTSSSNVDILAPSRPIIQRDPNHVNKTEVLSQSNGQTKVEVLIGDDLKTLTETVVYIRCPAIGIPRPVITFYKDGVLLDESEHTSINTLGSLVLTPAAKRLGSDGVYTCRAKNNGGYHELNTTLKLYDPAKPEFLNPVTKPRFRYDKEKSKGFLYMTVGQNARAYPNTILVISCPVSGFPFPVVIWEKDGKAISSGDIAILKDNATTLAFNLNNDGDGGVFTCVAANTAGTVRKESTINMGDSLPARVLSERRKTITAQGLETNITIGQDASIMAGSTLKVLCPTLGEPKPIAIWSHDSSSSGDLETNPNVKFDENGLEITIRKITKALAGIYRCRAKNTFGSDMKYSKIRVADSSSPSITVEKKKVISNRATQRLSVTIGGELFVHRNKDVIINCPVKGFPPPKITWYKDDEIITKNKKYTHINRRLRIKQASVENDGIYKCKAENFLESVYAKSRMFVGFAPYIQKIPAGLSPIISSTENAIVKIPIGVDEAYIRLGSTATFRCISTGHPQPTVRWSLNGQPIDFNNTEHYESLIPTVLSVKKVTAVDQGKYKCHVENVYGRYWRETNLAAMEPPAIQSDRSNITITKPTPNKRIRVKVGGSVIVNKGMSVIVECPVIGIPDPQITWQKINSSVSMNSRIYLTREFDLMVSDGRVEDSGVWRCTANNKVGSATSDIILTVAEKPVAVIYPDYRRDKLGRSSLVSVARRKLVIPMGGLIRLRCHVRGSPLPKVTWLKGHKIVRPTSGNTINGNRLEIRKASKEDVGTYLCMARNVMGATTTTTQIIIGAPPLIDDSKQHNSTDDVINFNIGEPQNVRVGATVRIHCNASGLPKPSIIWTVVKGKREIKTRIQSDVPEVMTIRDFSIEDEGVYECEARNYIGTDKAVSLVSLLDSARITSEIALKRWQNERLFMFNGIKDCHVVEGEAVRLVCAGIGYPTPTVTFYRHPQNLSENEDFVKQLTPFKDILSRKDLEFERPHGKETNGAIPISDNFRQMRRLLKIRYEGRKQRFITLGQLYTSQVEVQSSGLYTCKSSNKAGYSSKHMHIYVHPKPDQGYKGVWVALKYGECQSPCARSNYGIQRRTVYCMARGGQVISNTQCVASKRPTLTKECPSTECVTEWRPGLWSECSRTCGDNGRQYRSPECIYSKSKKSTSLNNCPRETKPRVIRKCNSFPCDEGRCVDRYQYCKLITGMGFCQVETYKTYCCRSCVKERGNWGKH